MEFSGNGIYWDVLWALMSFNQPKVEINHDTIIQLYT